MKHRIIIDMDETITNLLQDWFLLNNSVFEDHIQPSDVRVWDIAQLSKGGKAVYDLLKTPGLFINLKAKPGAIAAIQQLSSDYELFIGSAVSSDEEATEKMQWVKEHLPFIAEDHIAFTREKHKNLFPDLELLVDDAPHNINSFYGLFTIALRYPHNQSATPTRFASNWKEIEEMIRELLPIEPKK
jgi:5'(3')-deoxyribonucleotidase